MRILFFSRLSPLAAVTKEAGHSSKLTPSALLGASGTTNAAALVKAIPWLSAATAPIITGLVIIIGTIGIDAYCRWTASHQETKKDEQ